MQKYIKSISSNLPSNIVLLRAGLDKKCPVDVNNFPMKEWTKRRKSDIYDSNWSNYAMLTGSVSGLWVFDIDNKENNVSNMFRWFLEHDFDPTIDAFTVQTPSGGFHIYFKYENNIDGHKIYNKFNDIQSNGHCVIFIDSSYSNGSYELLNDVPITSAPEFIIEAIIGSNYICNSSDNNMTPETQSVCSDIVINNTNRQYTVSDYHLKYCDIEQKIYYINEIAYLIDPTRLSQENTWSDFRFILINELGFTQEAYNIFLNISKKDKEGYERINIYTKLSESAEVKHKWDSTKISANSNQLTLGTLIRWDGKT
jgi:hypothetical protein